MKNTWIGALLALSLAPLSQASGYAQVLTRARPDLALGQGRVAGQAILKDVGRAMLVRMTTPAE